LFVVWLVYIYLCNTDNKESSFNCSLMGKKTHDSLLIDFVSVLVWEKIIIKVIWYYFFFFFRRHTR